MGSAERCRSASRRRRRIRLRSTAPPVFFVTVKPIRAPPAGRVRAALWRVKARICTRLPLAAFRKSARRRSLSKRAGAASRSASESGFGRFRRKAACGPERDGPRSPYGRRPSPCGRESHAGACARACWVDRSASPCCSVSHNGSNGIARARRPLTPFHQCRENAGFIKASLPRSQFYRSWALNRADIVR